MTLEIILIFLGALGLVVYNSKWYRNKYSISKKNYNKGLNILAEQNACDPSEVHSLIWSELDKRHYSKQEMRELIAQIRKAQVVFKNNPATKANMAAGEVILDIYTEYYNKTY